MKFKNLPVLLVAVLMLGFVFTGCEKDMQNNHKAKELSNNKSIENKIFSELYLDSLELREEIYSSLDFFQNYSCENDNIGKIMTSYLKFKGIKEEINCDFKETEAYISFVIKSNPDEVINYLYKEKYLSKESAALLSNYVDEVLNSTEGEELEILQKYLTIIEKEKDVSLEEKDKIVFALQSSKYSIEYFDNFDVKGACSSCIRTNKQQIFIASTFFGLGPVIACVTLTNPVAIAACVIGVSSITTWLYICHYCRNDCWFCLN